MHTLATTFCSTTAARIPVHAAPADTVNPDRSSALHFEDQNEEARSRACNLERARQLAAAQSSTGMQPVAQAYAQPQPMAVTCPPGLKPGDSLVVTMGGQQVTVQVPQGVAPGGMFMVQPPPQQVVAVAVAQAMPA